MTFVYGLCLHLHGQPRFLQTLHQLPVQWVGEPGHHAFRNDRADVLDPRQFFGCGVHQGVHGFKMQRQQAPALCPDVPDAQGEQQFIQPLLLALFNGFQQVVRRFFAHPLQRQQLFFLQFIQIRRILHQLRVQQLVDHRRAAAFNVHGVPGGEMDQPFPA